LKEGVYRAPAVLRTMITYCSELKRENKALIYDVTSNCDQNHRLIDIIEGFMAFEAWWIPHQDIVKELMIVIDDLNERCTQLLGENVDMGEQIRMYLIEIKELNLRIEEMEQLRPIIEGLAW